MRKSSRGYVAGAALAALALLAAACSSGSTSFTSTPSGPTVAGWQGVNPGGTPKSGGTLNMLGQGDVDYMDYNISYYSIGSLAQRPWIRGLYAYPAIPGAAATRPYPDLATAPPVISNGGKTVTVNMKGWKWSNGETVDAKSLIFYMNMIEAEKANWYAYAKGLLPDNVVSYKATGPEPGRRSSSTSPTPASGTPTTSWRELTPMPMAWDVTRLGAKPGSGGCTTDSAADGWAKCKAVYNFLTAQSKNAATYATSPLWSVVDGPWKLSSFSTTATSRRAEHDVLRQPEAEAGGGQVRAVHRRLDRVHRAEDRAARRRLHPDARTCRRSRRARALPCDQPAGQRLHPAAVLHVRHPATPSPTSTTRQVGFMVRQLYVRQALQNVVDQPGMTRRSGAGTPYPTSGAVPTDAAEPVASRRSSRQNGGQGPYPFSIAKAKPC